MLENVLPSIMNIIEDTCEVHLDDSNGMKRIKQDLAEQLRERTKYMTDRKDVSYTPLYICAAYLAPKYSYAVTAQEKAVAAVYISTHVRLAAEYEFVLVCSKEFVVHITGPLHNQSTQQLSFVAYRRPRRHSLYRN